MSWEERNIERVFRKHLRKRKPHPLPDGAVTHVTVTQDPLPDGDVTCKLKGCPSICHVTQRRMSIPLGGICVSAGTSTAKRPKLEPDGSSVATPSHMPSATSSRPAEPHMDTSEVEIINPPIPVNSFVLLDLFSSAFSLWYPS